MATQTSYGTKKRNQYIAFSKAYAIVTIVIYHFCLPLSLPKSIAKIIDLGGGGVHLFIFASGFGLYLSKYTGFTTFLKKRVSKVLLPYYIAVSLIFLANLFLHVFKDDLRAFLSHIFLYKMFIEKYEGSFGGQFWFVSTIIQFYLVYPLLLKLVKKYSSAVCIISCIAISIAYSIIISSLGYGDVRVVNSFFIQYLWEFVLGMVIAKEGIIDKITNIKWYLVLVTALLSYSIMALLVLGFGNFGRNINDVFSFIGYTGMSIVVYSFVAKFKWILKTVMQIEPISYQLFLTHTFVYVIFEKFIFHPLTIKQVPVVFIAALVVAKLFTLLLSKKQVLISQNITPSTLPK